MPNASPRSAKCAKKDNRINLRFDDELTAAIRTAGAAIKVEGQDFVRMAVKKLIREVAETGQVILKVDTGTREVCRKAVSNDE